MEPLCLLVEVVVAFAVLVLLVLFVLVLFLLVPYPLPLAVVAVRHVVSPETVPVRHVVFPEPLPVPHVLLPAPVPLPRRAVLTQRYESPLSFRALEFSPHAASSQQFSLQQVCRCELPLLPLLQLQSSGQLHLSAPSSHCLYRQVPSVQ